MELIISRDFTLERAIQCLRDEDFASIVSMGNNRLNISDDTALNRIANRIAQALPDATRSPDGAMIIRRPPIFTAPVVEATPAVEAFEEEDPDEDTLIDEPPQAATPQRRMFTQVVPRESEMDHLVVNTLTDPAIASYVASRHSQLNSLIVQATKLQRELNEKMRVVDSVGILNNLRDQIGLLRQNRAGMPDVVDVEIANDRLVILTNEIISESNGKRFRIGHLEIGILLGMFGCKMDNAMSNNIIRVNNLDRVVNGFTAPHVKQDSGACFGNGFGVLVRAFAEGNLLVILSTILQVIKHPDVNDSFGRHVTDFPEVIA